MLSSVTRKHVEPLKPGMCSSEALESMAPVNGLLRFHLDRLQERDGEAMHVLKRVVKRDGRDANDIGLAPVANEAGRQESFKYPAAVPRYVKRKLCPSSLRVRRRDN